MSAFRSVLMIGLVMLAATPAAAQVPFSTQPAVGSTLDSASVVLADIDGDGDLDQVASGSGVARLIWYENTSGDGSTWTSHTISSTYEVGTHVIAADVDGDGDVDVMSSSISDFSWHENDGTPGLGEWAEHLISSTGINGLVAPIAVDVDLDGDLDFVAPERGTNRVSWFENDGTPSVGAWALTSIGTLVDVNWVATGDLDGDGRLDVVAASTVSIIWYENDTLPPTSAWTARAIDLSGSGFQGPTIADIDRDGDEDIIAISAAGSVTWYENDGTPAIGSWPALVLQSGLSSPRHAVIEDIDRDGELEVLVATNGDDKVVVLDPEGAPGVIPWNQDDALTGVEQAVWIAVGDIDGDGDPDLATSDIEVDLIEWHENEAIHRSANYLEAERTLMSNVAGASSVRTGDLDGDGDLDAILPFNSAQQIVWLENQDGQGGSWSSTQVIDAAFTGGANTVTPVDLDRDGDLDAVAASAPGDRVAWFENTAGDASAWTTHTVTLALDGPTPAVPADLDGDGDEDLIIATSGIVGLHWLENDGSGGAWTPLQIASPIPGVIGAPDVADMDLDGDLDIVWVYGATSVVWFENTSGDGSTWTEHAITTTTGTASATEIADLDGDGDPDILIGTSDFDDEVTWLDNAAGTGLVWASNSVGSADDTKDLRVADLDQDGDLDIAGVSSADDRVRWWESRSIFFVEHVVGTLQDFPSSLQIVDLDADGDEGLLVVSAIDGAVVHYPNLGGQISLTTTSVAYLGMVDGGKREIFMIDVGHEGRSGDTDAEVAAIGLLLLDDVGAPLSSADANAAIASVEVVRDGGNDIYDDGLDPVVATFPTLSLVSGGQKLGLPEGDLAIIDAGAVATYFVVVTLDPAASLSAKPIIEWTHLSEGGTQVENTSNDVRLTIAFEADTSTGPVEALPSIGDADADGVQNGAEQATHGTDPLNPDTEGDGVDDGTELSNGSDPLDSDSDDDGLDDGAEQALGTSPILVDTDADGHCDGPISQEMCTAGDNCPLVDNAGQSNSDAFAAGDSCQCGDVNNSDDVDATDLLRLREYVAGRTLTGSFVLDRCDVFDSGADGVSECDIADVARLERALQGAESDFEYVCAAYRDP